MDFVVQIVKTNSVKALVLPLQDSRNPVLHVFPYEMVQLVVVHKVVEPVVELLLRDGSRMEQADRLVISLGELRFGFVMRFHVGFRYQELRIVYSVIERSQYFFYDCGTFLFLSCMIRPTACAYSCLMVAHRVAHSSEVISHFWAR